MVRDMRARYGRLRVYGEAVDVLVRSNNFVAAERLEQFWNRLAADAPMTIFCSYMAEHFGNPRDAESLRHICHLHSRVHADPQDALGTFLLKTRVAC